MRRSSVVAGAVLIAALALAGLPAPVGSRSPSATRAVDLAAFTVINPALDLAAQGASGVPDHAQRSAGFADAATSFVEPGAPPKGPVARPKAAQPASTSGMTWKPPRYTISGYASFYSNGTTAMRLPRGTVVRICGSAGCIERAVTDYGPIKPIRIVDMYRPDFFQVCGCASFSGTTWVSVSIY